MEESVKVERIESDFGVESPLSDNFLQEWTESEDLKENFDTKIDIFSKVDLEDKSETKDGSACDVLGRKKTCNEDDEAFLPKGSESKKKPALTIDILIEGVCENAPVSEKATNLCSFKCPKCCKELSSWKLMKMHMKGKNDCELKVGYLNVAELIGQKVCHICKICCSTLLCDGSFMQRHLRLKHQLKLSEYITKFRIDCTKESRKVISYSDTIGNLCVYRCEDCKAEFNSWTSLTHHQTTQSHSKTSFKDKQRVMKSTYHKYKLCFKVVLCEKYILNKHIKRCHGLSLQEYCRNTNCEFQYDKNVIRLESLKTSTQIDNLCIFTCHMCNQKFFRSGALDFHSSKKKHLLNQKQTKLTHQLVSGFSYKCKICTELMLCDRRIIRKHMTRRHPEVLIKSKLQEYQKSMPIF